jgi:hypothetical protein
LSPARQEIESALHAVRRAKGMVKKLADRYDHNAVKEEALDIHRELVDRHAASEAPIKEVRTHVWLASSRSAWNQFAALDLAEQMESQVD